MTQIGSVRFPCWQGSNKPLVKAGMPKSKGNGGEKNEKLVVKLLCMEHMDMGFTRVIIMVFSVCVVVVISIRPGFHLF